MASPLYPAISAAARSTGSLFSRFASKMNVGSMAPGAVLRAIKENPATAALIALELGDEAGPMLEDILAAHPEVASVLRSSEEVDDVDDLANDYTKLTDEFTLLGRLERRLGWETMMDLHRFMRFKQEHFAAYIAAKEQSRLF